MRRALILSAVAALGLLFFAPTGNAGGGGLGCEHGGAFEDARTNEVSLADLCFSPNVARIEAGDTVTFVNDDVMLHYVGGVYDTYGGEHVELQVGGEASFTFEDEGTFPFVCTLHPGMIGAVVVGDGEGEVTQGAVAGGTISSDDAGSTDAAPATESASAEAPASTWLLTLAALVGLAIAGAIWLPRRKTHAEA